MRHCYSFSELLEQQNLFNADMIAVLTNKFEVPLMNSSFL